MLYVNLTANKIKICFMSTAALRLPSFMKNKHIKSYKEQSELMQRLNENEYKRKNEWFCDKLRFY